MNHSALGRGSLLLYSMSLVAKLDHADPATASPARAGIECDYASTDFSHRHGDNRRDSKVSLSSSVNNKSHQAYLDSLVPPSSEEITRISSVQEEKEEEILAKKYTIDQIYNMSDEERAKAAGTIQRNYRGYRARRELNGMSIDPTSRWIEAIREARYRNLTTPRARPATDSPRPSMATDGTANITAQDDDRNTAKEKWRKIGFIAKRAAGDEDSDVETSSDDGELDEKQRDEKRRLRLEQKKQREKEAKTMDLQYFLEMVDLKHRYGSNLKIYHQEWQKAPTNENFFYWLDHGEGRKIEVQGCTREKLDRERVRYLSREERLNYLVKIDKEGRLCWAKNGARIDTTEKWKDSVHGIVPSTDSTPAYVAPEIDDETRRSSSASSSSSSDEHDRDHHRTSSSHIRTNGKAAPSTKKVKHVSASTILDALLRGSVQANTWIFVADTSFRLYVGIKQSGAFQHSSFLHGSRIAAAGLIKIRDGRLDKLSPLSGHYRPHTSQFRAFVGSLREAGCDMGHVSVGRSYAVLVGLEAYVRARRKGKRIVTALLHGRDRLLSPTELKQREERDLNEKVDEAAEYRLKEIQREEDERDANKANISLMKKLHIRPRTPTHER